MWYTGNALRQLEIGLIGKIKRFQRENSAAIKKMVIMTSVIQNTFGPLNPTAPTIESVSVEWQSPEILDVGAQIAVLVQMRKDAPNLWGDAWYREQIGALLGMAAKTIEEEGDNVSDTSSRELAELTAAGTGTVPVA